MTTETTTDMERLRARDELREALTEPCKHENSAWRDTAGSEPFCPDCGAEGVLGAEPWVLEEGRVPLAPDSAQVALERWVHERSNGTVESSAGHYEVWWQPDAKNGTGSTLAGAVLAALEAT